MAGDERQAPTDAPVKPQGLVIKHSKKEEAERKETLEKQEKRAAAAQASSERMKQFWQERKAAKAEQPAAEEKIVRGPGGRVLSQAEMESIKPELIKILMDYGEYLNQAIRGTSRTKAPCSIWDLDEEEAEPIAHVLLMQARKSVRAAARVRNLIDSAVYVRSGAVLLPRFAATWRYYAENGIGILPPLPIRRKTRGER